jgi:hypothetical protein
MKSLITQRFSILGVSPQYNRGRDIYLLPGRSRKDVHGNRYTVVP